MSIQGKGTESRGISNICNWFLNKVEVKNNKIKLDDSQ